MRAINLLKITAESAADVLISSQTVSSPSYLLGVEGLGSPILDIDESVRFAMNAAPSDLSSNSLASPVRNTVQCPFECGEIIEAPSEASGVALTLTASHFLLQKHMLTCKKRVGGNGSIRDGNIGELKVVQYGVYEEDESDISSDSSVQDGRNESIGGPGGKEKFDLDFDSSDESDDDGSW